MIPFPKNDPSLILSQTETTEPYYYILMKDCNLQLKDDLCLVTMKSLNVSALYLNGSVDALGLMLGTPLSTNYKSPG